MNEYQPGVNDRMVGFFCFFPSACLDDCVIVVLEKMIHIVHTGYTRLTSEYILKADCHFICLFHSGKYRDI